MVLLPHKNPKNQNFEKWKNLLEISSFYTCVPKITIIWCTVLEIRSVRQTEFFVILVHFLPFQPPDNLETQNFKIKKAPGDIFILHICTINYSHMMYGSWGMECNGQNFLSFWTIFCPFTPLTKQKIKILKKRKKCMEILSFYTGVP